MFRIPSASTDQKVPFTAVDVTDGVTYKTGLSGFTVYRCREGGTPVLYTTPTIAEVDATNCPGEYWLTVDEDTTIGGTHDDEIMTLTISHASARQVKLAINLYRPKVTKGETVTAANGAADADIERIQGTVINTPSVAGILEVDVTHFNGTAGTFAAGRPEVNTTHAAGTAWGSGAITAASIASNAITSAKIATDAIGAAQVAADAIDASALAADAATEIGTAVWATASRTLTANTNLNDLSAAGVRAAVGLASANLDTQLSTIDDFLDTEIAAIKAKTDQFVFTAANRVDAQVFGIQNNAITAASIATDAIDNDAIAANAVTEIQSGLATSASIAALNNLSAAQVNAEVVDALATDTYAEPTGVPGATVSLAAKIGRLYQMARNQIDVTADAKLFYDDSGVALWKKALSDDGTTYSEAEGSAP